LASPADLCAANYRYHVLHHPHPDGCPWAQIVGLVFGLLQSIVYVTALGSILADVGNWMKIIGYSAGFATGLVVGMSLEDRLAVGFTHFRITSPARGLETADTLRSEGYAVTEVSGLGKDGAVMILHCSVRRKNEADLVQKIKGADPNAFITAESVRQVQHGFWHR
jgi:uncharacterized protein YebE (UPF0316 family)